MINVQFKHAPFSNSILNDECGRYLNFVTEDLNKDRPDRFWILTNESTQLFTYGTKSVHNSAEQPSMLNGIPVMPQIRSGGITYHGPGQLTWICMLNYRRLVRHGDVLNLDDLLERLRLAVNAEFDENLVANYADPGLYRASDEKILSYGADAPGVLWVALKVSLNLHVNLDVYQDTTICGVHNRPMGNLLPSRPDLATQAQIGENIMRRFCDLIYLDGHQIVDWVEQP
jgi:lipoate-protein ligase B